MMRLVCKAVALITFALIVTSGPNDLFAQSGWQPASDGRYVQRVKALFEKTYKIANPVIRKQHFSGEQFIGDVDLFQVSENGACETAMCYYALFSADLGEMPILTGCTFERAFFAHLHHPDGSKFFAFEFSCDTTFTYVHVSKDHYWVTSTQTKR